METPGTNDNPQQIQNYIARAVAKGYPAEIFSGSRSEDDIVAAMGTHMKNEYLALNYPASVFDSCTTPVEVKNAALAYREALIQERAGVTRTTEITERVEEYKNRRALAKKSEQYIEENLQFLKDNAEEKKAHAISEYHRKRVYEKAWESTSVFLTIYSGIFISGILMYVFAIFFDKLKPNDPESFKIILENLHQRTWAISLLAFSVCLLIYMMYRFNRITDSEYSAYREDFFRPKKQPSYQVPVVITPAPVIIDQKPVTQVIELSSEEKVEQLEKNAALAERTASALLRARAASQSLEKAANEDAIEKARRLQKIERENNPPRTPPPMTPEEKVEAMADLKKRENLKIEELRRLGYEENSNAIDDVRASYEKELKKLLNSTRSAK